MTESMPWHLYLIRCGDGSLYTGIALDVDRRFAEHQQKGPAGAKYLRGRGPLTIVFRKNIGPRSLALRVELKVKKLPKRQKEKLITDDYRLDSLIERLQRAVAPTPPTGHNAKPVTGQSL
jgi:putative endonuclease